jgi:mannose/cellobiose epimerase-like protein (N-acyl-D-glucosamine 2-epimerase family)
LSALTLENQAKRAAAEARSWLFEAAFPLWATAGFDAGGGLFCEGLDLAGAPVAVPLRVRVQARQTYVFAEAGRLGWPGPWRELVAAGLNALVERCFAKGGAVGHLLDASGRLIDARRDLYDQAFALLGLANARSIDPQRADGAIARIINHLTTQRGQNGGFLEGEVKAWPRRQNPHMHLFEAAMALMEAGAPRGRTLAAECVELFDRVFFDTEHGALGEYFEDDFSRARGELGDIAEPGHHFEWIWLLERWRRLSAESRLGPCRRLWAHALAHGLNGPVAIDEVWRRGGAKTRSARLWPQTERLKAALILFEATGEQQYLEAVPEAWRGLRLYLDGVMPGLWRDRLSPALEAVDEPSPASSLYHITLALAELIRVFGSN